MLKIVEGILKGDRRSLSRAISIIDNEEGEYQEIIRQIFKKTGKAMTIGFTGPGGAGKSSLIGKLIDEFKEFGYKIAIIAVDPTSPITGGAILGDRIRMQGNIIDNSDVFMRSIASRGAIGGVSKSLRNIIRILDAAGYNLIIVESVGAGQLEIEVSKIVNLTVVLFTPNTGDKVQAIKAGITEIGDIYIVNKADIEGANTLYNTIKDLIGETEKKPIILKCSAKTGIGIKEVAENIYKMLNDRVDNFKEKELGLLEIELKDMVLNILEDKILSMLKHNPSYYNFIDKIQNKKMDPYQAADDLTSGLLNNKQYNQSISKKYKKSLGVES
ncbi:MAG TPA: methylmalonyl Co-A mutase-associated GTPase MeaB [Nitrososphaeraceae archaeon]|nr:methylmalonyl Co-A mutase-associated GTPase MeaB [Nitrososphaeraceae archaeon]